MTLSVIPYTDAINELAEVVQISVLNGTGYVVGSPAIAQLSIGDSLPEISIEALEPMAIKADGSPAFFAVNRAGVLDRSVLVRLQISGTASNGVDYVRINSFLNLSAGQTAGLIEINPTAGAVLQSAKSVDVAIKTDAAYNVGQLSSARVLLVDQLTSFVQWRAENFPGSTGSIEAFAAQDPGNLGIPNLQRYAFGLNAQTPERARLPRAVLRQGYLTMDVNRRANAADVQYVAEVSPNFSAWSASSNAVQTITPAEYSANPNMLTFRALPGTAEGQQLFMRLRVLYRP
jgi:hypothetical protein